MNPAQAIPVGTIVPFAGDVTDTEVAAWVESQGWLPCDGRSVAKRDYIDLFIAIESSYGGGGTNFNLPDLRGRFPRGVNGSRSPALDPDASTRQAAAAGGNVGNNIGSVQPTATGAPTTPFQTDTSAQHAHDAPHAPVTGNAYAVAGQHYGLWNEGQVATDSSGGHTHVLTGGDAETRPLNLNVNHIIRFSAAPT
jgi:microcystin-dependent protein